MAEYESSEQGNKGLNTVGSIEQTGAKAGQYVAKKASAKAVSTGAKTTSAKALSTLGSALGGTSTLIVLGFVVLFLLFYILLSSALPKSMWFKDSTISDSTDGSSLVLDIDLENEKKNMVRALISKYKKTITEKPFFLSNYSSFANLLKEYLESNYDYSLNAPPRSASELGVKEISKKNINGLLFVHDNTKEAGNILKGYNLNWKPKFSIDTHSIQNEVDGAIETYYCRHYTVNVVVSPSPQEIKDYINAYVMAVNGVLEDYGIEAQEEYISIVSGTNNISYPSNEMLIQDENGLATLSDEGKEYLQDNLEKYEEEGNYETSLLKNDTFFYLDKDTSRWLVNGEKNGRLDNYQKTCYEQVRVISGYEVNPVTGKDKPVYEWEYMPVEYDAYTGQIQVMMLYNCEDYRKDDIQKAIIYVSNTNEPMYANCTAEEYINARIENYFLNILGGEEQDKREKYFYQIIDELDSNKLPCYGIPKEYFSD